MEHKNLGGRKAQKVQERRVLIEKDRSCTEMQLKFSADKGNPCGFGNKFEPPPTWSTSNICQPLTEMLQHIVKTTQGSFSLSVPPSHVCLFLFPEPEPTAPLAVQILPCLGLFYI